MPIPFEKVLTFAEGFDKYNQKIEKELKVYHYSVKNMLVPFSILYLELMGFSTLNENVNIDAKSIQKAFSDIGTLDSLYNLCLGVIGGTILINNLNQSEIGVNSSGANFIENFAVTDGINSLYTDGIDNAYTIRATTSASVDLDVIIKSILQANLPSGTILTGVNYIP